jgi:hypothetical protein
MPRDPRPAVTVDVTALRDLVPAQREPDGGPEAGILTAMAAEAERLAALDPPFTEATRARLRQMLAGT